MTSSSLIRRVVLITAVLCLPTMVLAAFGLPGGVKVPDVPKIGGGIAIPGLAGLTNEEPPITTSFADAVTEIPYLDTYSPEQPLPLEAIDKESNGYWLLPPGVYSFDAQSYCLHAGTHGPSKGEGYLLAPLKGPKAEIIRSIVEQSANHPEIHQEHVQSLIWAIQARTKISDTSRDVRNAASTLLTKEQLASLDKGTFGVIPDNQLSPILSKVTAPVRRMLEFENSLRAKLCAPNLPFAELEKVAVLSGDPPFDKNARVIPSMRWSYNPDGYFIRFKPHHYWATYFEVCCPGRHTISRDDRGRITEISDSQENIIKLTYDDTITAAAVAGDDGVRAYALSSIAFSSSVTRNGAPVTSEWKNTGWVLVGQPNGKGKPEQGSGRFIGLKARYEEAVSLAKEFADETNKARRSLDSKKSSPISSADMGDMVDLCHLNAAISEVVAFDAKQDAVVAWQAQEIIGAWQYVFKRSVNGEQVLVSGLPQALIGLGVIGKTLKGDDVSQVTPLNPSKNVATPSETGRQRLQQSSRGTNSSNASQGSNNDNWFMKWVREKMKDWGLDVSSEGTSNGAQNGTSRSYGSRSSGSSSSSRNRKHNFMSLSLTETTNSTPPAATWDIVSATITQHDGQTTVGVRFTDTKSGRIVHLGKASASGEGQTVLNSTIEKAVKSAGL